MVILDGRLFPPKIQTVEVSLIVTFRLFTMGMFNHLFQMLNAFNGDVEKEKEKTRWINWCC